MLILNLVFNFQSCSHQSGSHGICFVILAGGPLGRHVLKAPSRGDFAPGVRSYCLHFPPFDQDLSLKASMINYRKAALISY